MNTLQKVLLAFDKSKTHCFGAFGEKNKTKTQIRFGAELVELRKEWLYDIEIVKSRKKMSLRWNAKLKWDVKKGYDVMVIDITEQGMLFSKAYVIRQWDEQPKPVKVEHYYGDDPILLRLKDSQIEALQKLFLRHYPAIKKYFI